MGETWLGRSEELGVWSGGGRGDFWEMGER